MATQVLFYIFASICVISALMVITSRNPVQAVLSLVSCFVAAAALWLLIEAEFLALVLIVVYVGAVMVLFLFVVMMLDIDIAEIKASFVRYWPVAAVAGLGIIAVLVWAVGPGHFGPNYFPAPQPHSADYSNIQELGMSLFTNYLYPFELAAVILLAAMVAAITLTFRGHRSGTKSQIPSKQVAVKAQDRLRIIKMPAEKPNQQGDQS
ncbi:MAG: NADH:ubiquinone oxidoreductase subunit 6 [Gammaproteobacteria bacterium]|jgi:NADH-quinone oxidoreductase subunit J|nr:NADH:ubiquinone oxidoreductase subunit 6 [Gammaproteobacteria bacterium]